jgi:hypothetical protein
MLPKTKRIQSKIFDKNKKCLLVSYFWGKNNVNKGSIHGLTYGEQVDRIVNDCHKHKVNYYFVEYPVLKTYNYQEALALKPEFLQYCLDKFSDFNCIFIDTDFRVLRYPYIFETDADCWFMNWNEFDFNCYNPLQLELPGGVFGFANTNIGRQILDILTNNLNPKHAEDKTFSGIITRHFLNIYARCVWLPSTYLYMFEKHVYVPKQGYTKVVNYKQELKGSDYKLSDLVLVHEDFETSALDDIFNSRVKVDRYPPKTDLYLGQKLRCYDVKFDIYDDWGLTKKQAQHYDIDWGLKVKEKIANVKSVPSKFLNKTDYTIISQKMTEKSNFIVLSCVTPDTNINEFIHKCEKLKMKYVICEVADIYKTNIPYVIYKIMTKYNSSILYLDINVEIKKMYKMLNNTEMDFMCYNMNNDFKVSKCFDPRILKMLNMDVLFLANNDIVKQFLLIWSDNNSTRCIKAGLQHKSLEYSFNVSLALNKLRCFWFTELSFNNEHKYTGLPKKFKTITKLLEQCGIKPKRKYDGDPKTSHYKGSRGKGEKTKYSHLFEK